MIIDEAIEVNTTLVKELDIPERAKEREAISLGIEALKRVDGNRHYPQPTVYPLLPGETKEE